jgi:pyrroline-5-carboxylate reductase
MERIPIGIIGAGQMATALVRGWSQAGLLDLPRSLASARRETSCQQFTNLTGIRCQRENALVARETRVLILGVKPHIIPEALDSISGQLTAEHLIISLAAGVRLERYAQLLPAGTRVIRVMPNTPAMVGACAAGTSANVHVTPEDRAVVDKLFSTVGVVAEVPENLLDAVTGLSGSGPAYVYLVIEALTDGGVRKGLPRATALKLAAQTVLGAAKMVLDTGSHPAVLKDAVTSPGGTTIAGLHQLEIASTRAAFMNAVVAAADRASELSQPSNPSKS